MTGTAPTAARGPLLLLDVDGVLNPYPRLTRRGHNAPDPYYRVDDTVVVHPRTGNAEPIPFLVNPEHGAALLALTRPEHGGFRLVWATTWEDEANRVLAPLLGLPALPVIPLPDSADWTWKHRTRHRGSGKAQMLATWLDTHAPGQPWAWVDDEVNRHDRTWFANWYRWHDRPAPHLLHRVEAHHGLRETDLTILTSWAQHLSDPEGTLNP